MKEKSCFSSSGSRKAVRYKERGGWYTEINLLWISVVSPITV
jgi:hypothetical protein